MVGQSTKKSNHASEFLDNLYLSKLMTHRCRIEEVEASTSKECHKSHKIGPKIQACSIP